MTKISVSFGAIEPWPCGAVAEVRRDDEQPAAALAHAGDALIPAGDDHLRAELELERVAAVPRGVELLAVGERDADVLRRVTLSPCLATLPVPLTMSRL